MVRYRPWGAGPSSLLTYHVSWHRCLSSLALSYTLCRMRYPGGVQAVSRTQDGALHIISQRQKRKMPVGMMSGVLERTLQTSQIQDRDF